MLNYVELCRIMSIYALHSVTKNRTHLTHVLSITNRFPIKNNSKFSNSIWSHM